MAGYDVFKYLRLLFIVCMTISLLVQLKAGVSKYLEETVMDTVTIETSDSLLLPPIAIVTTTSRNIQVLEEKTGKKYDVQNQQEHLNVSVICPGEIDFHRCYKDYSFEKDDIFQEVWTSAIKPIPLNQSTVLQKGPVDIAYGTCFYFNPNVSVGTSYIASPVIFFKEDFISNHSLLLVLHNQGQLRPSYDEHYLSQPSVNLRLTVGQLAVVTIELTENENLNVQKSPCESDPNYDLGLCLESYLSKNASCKLPWSPRRSLIPERDCETADDFSRLMFIQEQYRDWTSHRTDERTKCLKPCKYQSFKAEVSYQTMPPFNFPSKVGVAISYKQSAIIKKKQLLIYNFNSLIAEIGGSMGVFIGASFITIYDLALDGIGILSKLFGCNDKAK